MQYDTTTPAGLKAARKTLGMTNQAQLADALGVHEITVAKWESGAAAIAPKGDMRTALAIECLLRRAIARRTTRRTNDSPTPEHGAL